MNDIAKTIIIGILFCWNLDSKATSLNPELDSLKVWAAQNHPQLKAAYRLYEASLANVYGKAFLPDPSFSFGYFISPVETRLGPQLASFGLQQMLPWRGTLNASKTNASEMAKLRFEKFKVLKLELFKAVEMLYYEAEHLHYMKQFTTSNIKLLNEIKQQALLNVSVGLGAGVDVLRIDLEINDLENQIETFAINQQSSIEILALKCGKPNLDLKFDAEELIETDFLAQNTTDLNLDSVTIHPLLQVVNHQLNINKSNDIVLKQQALPKIGIGINYTLVGKRTDVNMVGNGRDIMMSNLSISLPIYQKKYSNQIKVNQLEREKIKLDYEAVELNLKELKTKVYSKKLIALKKMKLYEKQTESVKVILELLLTDYENGTANIEAILSTQKQLINYKIKNREGITELKKADAELKFILNQN